MEVQLQAPSLVAPHSRVVSWAQSRAPGVNGVLLLRDLHQLQRQFCLPDGVEFLLTPTRQPSRPVLLLPGPPEGLMEIMFTLICIVFIDSQV